MKVIINTQKSPRIGDVYTVDFEGSGSVQRGIRPAVVFQNDTGNEFSPNVIVFPLTSSLKRLDMPTHVLVSSDDTALMKDSMVLCENPQCVSKQKLGRYITKLPDKYLENISVASLMATSALKFLTVPKLLEVWSASSSL